MTTTTICDSVKGNGKRLRALLKEGVETRRYTTDKGARGAVLYALAQQTDHPPLPPHRTTEEGVDANEHELWDSTPSYPEEGVNERPTKGNPPLPPFLPLEEEGVEEGRQTEADDADTDIPF